MTNKVLSALYKIAGTSPEVRQHLDASGLQGVEADYNEAHNSWHFDDKSGHKDHISKRLEKMSPEFWSKLNALKKRK